VQQRSLPFLAAKHGERAVRGGAERALLSSRPRSEILHNIKKQLSDLSTLLQSKHKALSGPARCERWISNPSGTSSQDRLIRGTVTGTMSSAARPSGRARRKAGAGCPATKLSIFLSECNLITSPLYCKAKSRRSQGPRVVKSSSRVDGQCLRCRTHCARLETNGGVGAGRATSLGGSSHLVIASPNIIEYLQNFIQPSPAKYPDLLSPNKCRAQENLSIESTRCRVENPI